ncbi:hypothetical protein O3M35_002370 [Rhynocoris fuscipes]|uniref:Structural maintenance of chromosomes protein 5 n=1 Tax=Rhynocoris fuscipes TaxID=488301 RepID=A0AAW1CRX3_9HEMI
MSEERKKGLFKSPVFHKGMIVRMKLINFMTYDKVEIHAEPKINFILGPNGTGKSTFLCAIIIGLGGKPSIIGRSTNVADYIKRGCEQSKIKIELYNPDGVNYVISRIINADSTSCWSLQRKSASFEQISEVIEKLNIQINNLCMILPQDRVQDFAKMNKKQLLEHTQKLIGKGELKELFDKLCDIRKEIKEQNDLLKVKTQSYDKDVQLLKRMEIDVNSYRERQDTLKQIELMKKKEAWLIFEEKSSHVLQLREESEKLLSEYKQAKELLKPYLCSIKEDQKKELALNNKAKIQRKVVDEIEKKQNNMKRGYLMLKNKIRSVKDELKEKIEAEKMKEVEMNSLKEQIELIIGLFPKESEQQLIAELKQVENEVERLLQQFSQIKAKENDVRKLVANINHLLRSVQHRKEEAESVKDKKLSILHDYPDVHAAYKWLADNRNLFAGPIYGPLFIELNVSKAANAKYVETMIPHRDLIAFACERAEDTSKLLKLLRDERHLKVNVLNVPASEQNLAEMFPPPYPIETIKKYGFHNYLIDLVEGPDAVLKYLCSKLAFHRIPVGTDRVIQHADKIPSKIALFFAETKVFQIKLSKYSGERSQRVSDIMKPTFLAYSVDVNLIDSLNVQMEDKLRELNDVQNEEAELLEMKKKIEIELNQTRNGKKELSRKMEHLKTSSVRLRMKREELARLEGNQLNREAEEALANENLTDCMKEMVEVNSIYHSILDEYHQQYILENLLKLEVDGVAAKIKHTERELKDKEKNSLKLKERVDNVQSNMVKAIAETKLLYNKAKELTDGLDPDDPKFVEKYRGLFGDFPRTLHELKDHLAECEAMLRCVQENSVSDQVIRDYEEKKHLLDQLGKHVEKVETKLTVLQQQYSEMKNKWMPEISDLIENINEKFSRSFRFLGCAGAVQLDQGDKQEEVENYGISMKVKFRNDSEMLVLNPFSQSGGEKALTIAIFLLSLQSIIRVPFRWVDEINQGMDEYNEVRVYYLMMREVASDPFAQYFVITPKLVAGLRMSSETTVHCIYSGIFERKCDSEDEETDNESAKKKSKKTISSRKLVWSKEKYFEFLRLKTN